MSTVNPRITEIQNILAEMVNTKVQSFLGTDQERSVMNACMDGSVEMARELRTLVSSGLTYETWLEYYHTKCLDSTYAMELNVDDVEMLVLINELKALDLSEHYLQDVVNVQTIERLDTLIEHMVESAAQLRDIWVEEDECKETA